MADSKRATGRRRASGSAPTPPVTDWTIPVLSVPLRQRIGSSPLDEFVAAHGPADILRELVQNEFDGDGSDIGIRFGIDALEVTGAGRPITQKGWARLSVLMGTGEVLGDADHEVVDAKENSIGSKNFGLRSLFSFGDRIHVRSNGRMAILDIREFGAGRQDDPTSAGQAGVRVQVPYRTTRLRKLEPFSVERESHAIDEISTALLPTLVKLALGGKRPGIRSLTVTSERTGRELRWRQDAEVLTSRTPGVTVTRRSGRLRTKEAGSSRGALAYEELEFSRFLEIPEAYAGLDFPGYYRSGRRVRIALSLPMRGDRIVFTRPGHFYYPLQAGQARTGATVSVSAPFEMDGERTRPNPTAWNDWLTNEAATLATDLVGSDWFYRFGADAFVALSAVGPEEPGSFQTKVQERLRTAPCWPSQAKGSLMTASGLSVPDDPALEGHISASGYLDARLTAQSRVAELARSCGAKRFSINSLVRLRCAGETATTLATQLNQDQEASYRYTPYPGALQTETGQVASATALTALYKRLSNQNRQDLRDTPSTLAADGVLRVAKELVLVPADMWDGCPAPLPTRLHPALRNLKAVSVHCETFNLGRWILEATARAVAGTISEVERQALYRHILSPDAKFAPAILAAIRRSPVILDDAGDWAAPEDLALLPARDADVLNAVVRAPAQEVRTRPELLRRLSIRRKVVADDLVNIGRVLVELPDHAEGFEALLRRSIDLLTPKTVTALSRLAILRSRGGDLAPPATLHLPTAINLACLNEPSVLVSGDNLALYRRLGCRAEPALETLLTIIERARDDGTPPPDPGQLYPALVTALREEGEPLTGRVGDPILYVDGAYVTPHLCLATSRAPRCLQGAVPIFRSGGPVAEAYQALGASVIPRDQHWTAFFLRIDRQSPTGDAPISAIDRAFLRDAYQRRSGFGLPTGLPETVRCLLSDRATIHSVADLLAGTFLENDYPELAEALIAARAGIAFADRTEHSRNFMRALGLKALSQVVARPRITIGPVTPPPRWFHTSVSEKALAQLHRPDLAQAIGELAYAHQKQAPDFRPALRSTLRQRLAAVRQITFVSEITLAYRLGKTVSVTADAAVDGEQLALRPPRFRSEYEHVLAMELAQLAGASRLPDIRALAAMILPLLHSTTGAEMLGYLRRLGIQPKDWQAVDDDPDVEALEAEDEADATRQEIFRDIIGSVRIEPPSQPIPPAPPAPMPPPTAPPSLTPPVPPPVLPPVEGVTLSVSVPERTAPPPSAPGSSPGGYRAGSSWTPRTAAEIERDQKLGTRGEELVYRMELERVRALGYPTPEDHVIWTSRLNPGADHDICSIDAEGAPIWIEVKATTGLDGRFEWSIAEFEKALREGPRYELWRIYEAHTTKPKAKVFRDPATLLRSSILRLEIGVLRAFVESGS